MAVAWRAETVHGQIGPGTEFGIIPEAWLPGEHPKMPAVGTPLTVHFPNGAAARVDLMEVSGDNAIIQTSDGSKWRMENVGAKGLAYPPAVPTDAPATFWKVKERMSAPPDNIDPKSIVRLHLIGTAAWQHNSGVMIQAGDYDGYRALTRDGQRRLFLEHRSGSRADWLDIADHADKFMTFNHDDVGSRLAHTLGLSQSPGKDVMKKFAARTRALQRQQEGRTLDQAAMMAAKDIFPAEFQPTRYAGANHAIEPLLIEIEKL